MTDIEQRIAEALRQFDYDQMMYGIKKSYEDRAAGLIEKLGLKRESVWSRETGKNGYIWTTPMEYDEEEQQ